MEYSHSYEDMEWNCRHEIMLDTKSRIASIINTLGLRQDGVLSPTLFTVIVDDIIKETRKNNFIMITFIPLFSREKYLCDIYIYIYIYIYMYVYIYIYIYI